MNLIDTAQILAGGPFDRIFCHLPRVKKNGKLISIINIHYSQFDHSAVDKARTHPTPPSGPMRLLSSMHLERTLRFPASLMRFALTNYT